MVPALLAFLSFFSEQPSLLFLLGLTFTEWIALHVVGTFLGAIGGAASRPLFTERELWHRRFACVSSAPLPAQGGVRGSSRSGLPGAPPSGPARAE